MCPQRHAREFPTEQLYSISSKQQLWTDVPGRRSKRSKFSNEIITEKMVNMDTLLESEGACLFCCQRKELTKELSTWWQTHSVRRSTVSSPPSGPGVCRGGREGHDTMHQQSNTFYSSGLCLSQVTVEDCVRVPGPIQTLEQVPLIIDIT